MPLTADTRRILTGEPVRIEEPVPPLLASRGIQEWFVSQPDDWLYDDALTEYSAVYYRALQSPSVQALQEQEPDPDWIEARRRRLDFLTHRRDELMAIMAAATEEFQKSSPDHEPPTAIGLSPQEATELMAITNELAGISTDGISQAILIARLRASLAMNNYLLPRLLVDSNGHLLFDIDTKQGYQEWARLGRQVRTALLPYVSEVLNLAEMAKN